MKTFLTGLTVGLISGMIIATIFWLTRLPGPPSYYRARYPMSTNSIPDTAAHSFPHTVGFDIYRNPKGPPIFREDDATPRTRISTWGISSGHQGKVYIGGTFTVHYEGTLYEFGRYQQSADTSPNRYMSMVAIQSVDADRQFWERIIIPDIDYDETFGPYALP